MSKKYKILLLFVAILVCFTFADVYGQCPMCRMSAESNLENGGTEGRGLNRGILYMLSMPYLIIMTLGFIWYRNKKKLDNEKKASLN